MLNNRNVRMDQNSSAPRPEDAAPRSDARLSTAQRPLRLRVEEVEPRIAPNAIWGD